MTSPASLDAAVDRLRLIAEARSRGATWAQIGAGLKMTAREAKREVHRLERRTRRQFLIAAQARDDG